MSSFTKEDRIKTVYGGGGHVVITGAGNSIGVGKWLKKGNEHKNLETKIPKASVPDEVGK